MFVFAFSYAFIFYNAFFIITFLFITMFDMLIRKNLIRRLGV